MSEDIRLHISPTEKLVFEGQAAISLNRLLGPRGREKLLNTLLRIPLMLTSIRVMPGSKEFDLLNWQHIDEATEETGHGYLFRLTIRGATLGQDFLDLDTLSIFLRIGEIIAQAYYKCSFFSESENPTNTISANIDKQVQQTLNYLIALCMVEELSILVQQSVGSRNLTMSLVDTPPVFELITYISQ